MSDKRKLEAFQSATFPRSISAAILLSLLLLLVLPAAGQAQDFTYTSDGSEITITGYTGPGGAVTIPDTIDGLAVTRIAREAFLFNDTLTSVAISEGVTSIGYDAFYGCSSLTGVTIPSSVTSLESWGVFGSCSSLTSIAVDTANAAYSSIDGVLFNESQTMLIKIPGGRAGTYLIPESVAIVGPAAGSAAEKLTGVLIPDSVTNIMEVAFDYCSGLTSVTIPNSVTSIGHNAFLYCTGLTNVSIGKSVTTLDTAVFWGCTNLASVEIADGVSTIGASQFKGCTSLTSITIPDSVTSIQGNAFWDCTGLTSIYFEGDAPSPGNNASTFDSAENVKVYYLPGTAGWGSTYGGRPTFLWDAQVETTTGLGIVQNQLGFTITGTTGLPVVVEASDDLSALSWTEVEAFTLNGGPTTFSDPDLATFPSRFYRIRPW